MEKPNFKCLTFSQLSLTDLYQIMQLRSAVFVLEQACAYQDMDGLDQGAWHLYATDKGDQIIAYARILMPEQCNHTHSSIGRVVVPLHQRQQHLGKLLMQSSIEHALRLFPNHPLQISAQTYLTQFYLDLGFVNTGHYYLEDMIPHQEMRYVPAKK